MWDSIDAIGYWQTSPVSRKSTRDRNLLSKPTLEGVYSMAQQRTHLSGVSTEGEHFSFSFSTFLK